MTVVSNDSMKDELLQEAVIGLLLRYPKKILSIPLESRWFGKYRKVLDVMLLLAGNGIDIDVITVSDKFHSGENMLSVLGNIQLHSYNSGDNYAWYVEQVKTRWKNKSIRESMVSAIRSIDAGEAPTEVLNHVVTQMLSAQDERGQFIHDARGALRIFADKLTIAFDARDVGGLGLKTHIGKLDQVLGGIHPGDLTVVGARPSVGKTALGLSVLYNLARSGRKVGFFSVEMPVSQIMQRLIAIDTGINAARIRDADIQDHEWPLITASIKRLTELPIRICDRPVITITELAMQARAWAMQDGIDFVLIDYLTRVKVDKASGNQNLDVGEVVTGMKNIARLLNIPVMVLAQLNRQSANRSDKRPIMSDLRDSGIIEQEADQILMLHRDSIYRDGVNPAEAEIIVEKNRHGECGMVLCHFSEETMRWTGRYDER